MKKNLVFFILFFCSAHSFLPAQSNTFIDKLLEEKQATFGETALIALASAGLVRPEGTVTDAMRYLETNKWGFTKKAEDPATLGELCYLLMRGFKMNGGAMYAIAPGPRYATREFEYLGYVRRNPMPSRIVSGEEVMQIVGRLLTAREEEGL